MPSSIYSDAATSRDDHLLSTDDVARALCISPKTVSDYRRLGKPFFADKGVKLGRSLRWRPSDLVEYIASLPYNNE